QVVDWLDVGDGRAVGVVHDRERERPPARIGTSAGGGRTGARGRGIGGGAGGRRQLHAGLRSGGGAAPGAVSGPDARPAAARPFWVSVTCKANRHASIIQNCPVTWRWKNEFTKKCAARCAVHQPMRQSASTAWSNVRAR